MLRLSPSATTQEYPPISFEGFIRDYSSFRWLKKTRHQVCGAPFWFRHWDLSRIWANFPNSLFFFVVKPSLGYDFPRSYSPHFFPFRVQAFCSQVFRWWFVGIYWYYATDPISRLVFTSLFPILLGYQSYSDPSSKRNSPSLSQIFYCLAGRFAIYIFHYLHLIE